MQINFVPGFDNWYQLRYSENGDEEESQNP